MVGSQQETPDVPSDSDDELLVIPVSEEEKREMMLEMLSTPFDAVYAHDPAGTHFIEPPELRGVPVQRLNENGSYWEPGWTSLDDFLEQEDDEELKAAFWQDRHDRDPENQEYERLCKKHTTRASQLRKIREFFGPDTGHHPNQLVSKEYLPSKGLCNPDDMYNLACTLEYLDSVQEQYGMGMEPWYVEGLFPSM